jgi:hypothetical protein
MAAIHDPDLVAIGGVAAAIATIGLALIAFLQMRAARIQIEVMKATAGEQVKVLQDTAGRELAAVREQIEAAVKQNDAVREAARAQLQPIVFAHPLPATDGSLRYWMKNEGVGPALDVEHGISISAGRTTETFVYGGGKRAKRMRTFAAGEALPPGYPYAQNVDPFEVAVPRHWDGVSPVTYWTRFRNVFGDRFEVLNQADPVLAAEFRVLRD